MKLRTGILTVLLVAGTAIARAATIVGSVSDITGTLATINLTFTPLSNPQVDGGVIIPSTPKTITATNGVFSVNLEQGDYNVRVGRDQFQISVPNDSSTYNIESVTTDSLTYVYTVPPTSFGPMATPTTAGRIYTSGSSGTPTVYLTDEIDARFGTNAFSAFVSGLVDKDVSDWRSGLGFDSAAPGAFATNLLTQSTAYAGRSVLGVGEQSTNITSAGWRAALELGEQTTNTTAPAWRAALGLDVGTPGAAGTNLLVAARNTDVRATLGIDDFTPASLLMLQGANAPSSLTIPTYDGSGMLVHPSVLYVPEGWGGKRWWMAMTPYPLANPDYENPSILCSNDGLTWEVPSGVTNPLVADPGGSDYNADPNLFFAEGKLWIWYRYYDQSEARVYHRAIQSSDGVTWAAPVDIMDHTLATRNEVSPSVHWDGSAYHYWAIDGTPSPATLVYRTAATLVGLGSASPTVCTLNNAPSATRFMPWHGEVRRHGAVWAGCFLMTPQVGTYGVNLWMATSTNGTTWTFADRATLCGSVQASASAWDFKLYKASVVWNASKPLLFYGGVNQSLNSYKIGVTPLTETFSSPVVAYQDDRLDSAAALVGRANYSKWKLVDICDRADSALSPGNPTAPSATPWTQVSGVSGISGNRHYFVSGSPFSLITFDAGAANVEFSFVQDGSNSEVVVLQCLRNDASNLTHLGFFSAGVGTLSVYDVRSGSTTQLEVKGIGRALPEKWVVRVFGGQYLEIYYNGVKRCVAELAAARTGTLIGIRQQGSSSRIGEIGVRTSN